MIGHVKEYIMLINRTNCYSSIKQTGINDTTTNNYRCFESNSDEVSFLGILNKLGRNSSTIVFKDIYDPNMIINKPKNNIVLKECYIKSIIGKTIETTNCVVTDSIKGKQIKLNDTKATTVAGRKVIMNNCRFIKDLFAGSAEIAESVIKRASIYTSLHIRNNSEVKFYEGKLTGLSCDGSSNLCLKSNQ